MSTRERHALAALIGAFAVLAVGVAAANASRSAPLVRVPVAGYRLHASVLPVGSARGSGRFDGLLVRSGPGAVPPSRSPRVPAPPLTCPADPRMGIACPIDGDGRFPPFSIPPAGVHWLLVWRLGLTAVTGPATATIHLGTQGPTSPAVATLCTNCQTLARGHMTVTATQAQLLLKGQGYVGVQAAIGELSGHIVTVNHFRTVAFVHR